MNWHSPFFTGILDSHIQQFEQAVLIWKCTFSLGKFTKLAMDSLNGISGVDNSTDILRVLEKWVSTQPMVL